MRGVLALDDATVPAAAKSRVLCMLASSLEGVAAEIAAQLLTVMPQDGGAAGQCLMALASSDSATARAVRRVCCRVSAPACRPVRVLGDGVVSFALPRDERNNARDCARVAGASPGACAGARAAAAGPQLGADRGTDHSTGNSRRGRAAVDHRASPHAAGRAAVAHVHGSPRGGCQQSTRAAVPGGPHARAGCGNACRRRRLRARAASAGVRAAAHV